LKFSVIVPVYNVAEYLRKCLDSILPSLDSEDEIILALGPSTDGSTEICSQFAENDPRIQIVQQTGRGLSNARNCAIERATGDYIICIDSDDYVDSVCFETLLNRIRANEISEDLIIHDFYRFDRRTGQLIPFFQIGDIPDQTDPSFWAYMIRNRQCFWNVWRFIYRRSFLEQNHIFYMENVLSEDVDYTTRVFLATPSTRFVHYPFYVYTVGRGDSLMDRPTLKRLTDTVDVLTTSIFNLKHSDLRHASLLAARFQFEYILNISLIVELEKTDRKAASKLYEDWKSVLSDSSDPMVRVSYILLCTFGLQVVSCGLHTLKQLRRWLRNHTWKGV